MPPAQFTVNLEWCASEAHTRGESLLRGHGANRVKRIKEPNLTQLGRFNTNAGIRTQGRSGVTQLTKVGLKRIEVFSTFLITSYKN